MTKHTKINTHQRNYVEWLSIIQGVETLRSKCELVVLVEILKTGDYTETSAKIFNETSSQYKNKYKNYLNFKQLCQN